MKCNNLLRKTGQCELRLSCRCLSNKKLFSNKTTKVGNADSVLSGKYLPPLRMLTSRSYLGPVWPDWVVFERFEQQIALPKLLQNLATSLSYFEKCHWFSKTALLTFWATFWIKGLLSILTSRHAVCNVFRRKKCQNWVKNSKIVTLLLLEWIFHFKISFV